MELLLLYIAANVAIGAAACFFGKRLFYVVLGILVFVGVFNVALTAGDGSATALRSRSVSRRSWVSARPFSRVLPTRPACF